MDSASRQHQDDVPLSSMAGDAAALLPLVYDELRKLASQLMAKESPGHTLQPTALVHEAFARLADGSAPTFENRKHFFNTAARAMRRILIERGRRLNTPKHGAGHQRQDLDVIDIPAARDFPPETTEALEAALDELQAHNARWAQVVHLRYFLDLSIEQVGEVLGIAPATVKSDWAFARAWLQWRVSGK